MVLTQSRVTFSSANISHRTIHLNAVKMTLQDVSKKMYVDIGQHVVHQIDRREMKRQYQSTFDPYSSTTTSAADTVYEPTTVSIYASGLPSSSDTTVYVPTTVYVSASNPPSTSVASVAFSSSFGSSVPSEVAPASSPASIFSYTYTAPAVQPTNSATSQDVSFSFVDRVIIPPDQELAAELLPQSLLVCPISDLPSLC